MTIIRRPLYLLSPMKLMTADRRMRLMKSILKKGAAVFGALLMALPYPGSVFGAESPSVYVEDCSVEDGYLKIYTNNNISSQEQTLSAENFTITLGDTVLPCSQAVPFSDTGEGVAYVFLVDVSGSISSDRLEQMKEYLRRVTETLKDEDRVCLITLGNELAVGDFISGRDAITEEINGITGLYDDTNLYYGISQSLQILETSAQSLEKKALLVMSDGEDEQAAGITREEVSDQVEAAGIPVFTAAMLGDAPSATAQEFAKILGSFARLSSGGIHTAFGVDDISMEDSAARMAENINDSMVLYGDISGYDTSSSQAYLEVTLDLGDGGSSSDGRTISGQDMTMIAQANGDRVQEDAQPESAESQAGETSESAAGAETGDQRGESSSDSEAFGETGGEADSSGNTILGLAVWQLAVIGGVIGVIIVILILVIVLSRKKKHKNHEYPDGGPVDDAPAMTSMEEPLSPDVPMEDFPSEEIMDRDSQDPTAPEADDQGRDGEPDMDESDRGQAGNLGQADDQAQPQIQVYLTKIGMSEEKTYKIIVGKEVTLGRQPGRADYAFPEDGHMSAVHCAMAYFDHRLILWDKGSMNGTYVNGIPITAPYALNCDDIIHIGNTEFRIHW